MTATNPPTLDDQAQTTFLASTLHTLCQAKVSSLHEAEIQGLLENACGNLILPCGKEKSRRSGSEHYLVGKGDCEKLELANGSENSGNYVGTNHGKNSSTNPKDDFRNKAVAVVNTIADKLGNDLVTETNLSTLNLTSTNQLTNESSSTNISQNSINASKLWPIDQLSRNLQKSEMLLKEEGLQTVELPLLPNKSLHLYGSVVSELANSRTSDINLTLIDSTIDCEIERQLDGVGFSESVRDKIQEKLKSLKTKLEQKKNSKSKVKDVQIQNAVLTGTVILENCDDVLKFTITINDYIGLRSTMFLRNFASCPLVRDLTILLKSWARNTGNLGKSVNGQSLALLVINYLQKNNVLPIIAADSGENSTSTVELHKNMSSGSNMIIDSNNKNVSTTDAKPLAIEGLNAGHGEEKSGIVSNLEQQNSDFDNSTNTRRVGRAVFDALTCYDDRFEYNNSAWNTKTRQFYAGIDYNEICNCQQYFVEWTDLRFYHLTGCPVFGSPPLATLSLSRMLEMY